MSTERFVVCDKCGFTKFSIFESSDRSTDERFHLCQDCYELLKTWLKVGTGVKS